MRSFTLTRRFSALSLVFVILAGGVLAFLVRQYEIEQLKKQSEEQNVLMTQLVLKVSAGEVHALLAPLPNAAARSSAALRLDELIRGSSIARLKLYDMQGITVFSTEKSQIGESQLTDPGWRQARAGKVTSEFALHDKFSTFEGERQGAAVVASYIPVLEGGRTVAVFELYQDVTDLAGRIDRMVWQIAAAIGSVLAALYLLQLLVVRHAQQVIGRQEALLEKQNQDLDRRISERTTELQQSETRQKAILDSVLDAVITLDARGRIVGWNPAAERLFGYSLEEIFGDDTTRLVPDNERAVERLVIDRLFAATRRERSRDIELTCRRKDGSEFVAERSLALWATQEGQFATAIIRDMTERKAQEARIRELLQEQRLIFDNAHVGILLLQRRKILKSNQRIAEIFGYDSPADYEGQTTEMLYPSPEHFKRAGRDGYAQLAAKGFAQFEIEMKRRDGSRIWVLQSGRPLDPTSVLDSPSIWVYNDVTERKRADAELGIAATAFESQEAMIVTDADSVILRVNKAFTESTGYSAAEIVGKKPNILRSDRHDDAFYKAMWESVDQTGSWQGEIWDRRKDGGVFPKWLTITAVRDRLGMVTHYVGTHTDITERKEAEEKIKHLAFFDQLTGLPNRTLLHDRLRQAMIASERKQTYGALVFLDLDHFKTLNDTLGHDYGDLLLKEVAQILTRNVRQGDTVARLGGDEFVIVLAGLEPGLADAARSVESICRKLLGALKRDYQLAGTEFHASASMGGTLFLGQAANLEDLLKQADLAMYKSKAAGRDAFTFFDPTMAATVLAQTQMESELRRAIQERQLDIYYQAQIDGASGQVIGAEALLRWPHPERGMIPPDDFIKTAEASGLIVPIGHWVLTQACARLALWAEQPDKRTLRISVNVSVQQFRQPNYADEVIGVLRQSGVRPELLRLELTESLFAEDIEDIIAKMLRLKAAGIGFSLDDFGTGYSSLAYLSRLPLDELKIDRSFVADIQSGDNNLAICAATISLAHSLRLKVVAEGVEDAVQQYILTAAHKCDALQGYLFSRPLPVDEFEAFVAKRAELPRA